MPANDNGRPRPTHKAYGWFACLLYFLIARFMGPNLGPIWGDRTQVGPILAHEPCYLGYLFIQHQLHLHFVTDCAGLICLFKTVVHMKICLILLPRLQSGAVIIYHDIIYDTAMAAAERKSDFKLTTDICWISKQKWARYDTIALYLQSKWFYGWNLLQIQT